jgi:hypothetical protein
MSPDELLPAVGASLKRTNFKHANSLEELTDDDLDQADKGHLGFVVKGFASG